MGIGALAKIGLTTILAGLTLAICKRVMLNAIDGEPNLLKKPQEIKITFEKAYYPAEESAA